MIYDKIESQKITLGTPKKFDGNKQLTPVFYDGEQLEFTLKNKYFTFDGIRVNNFGKQYIQIKSKDLTSLLADVASALKVPSPVFGDASVRATFSDATEIVDAETHKHVDLTNKNSVSGLVSFIIPTIFEDPDTEKKSCQVNVSQIIVTKSSTSKIEFEMDKLSLAE